MTKTFIYRVGNHQMLDNEAFGRGWKVAQETAIKNHCAIYRTVISNKEVRNEFFANAGVFLNIRYFALEKLKVF